jgi:hypothetical protein
MTLRPSLDQVRAATGPAPLDSQTTLPVCTLIPQIMVSLCLAKPVLASPAEPRALQRSGALL